MKAGWEVKALGEVVEISSGGTPSKSRDDFWKGDIPWVSPKDMKVAVITDSEDHVSEAAVKESATRLIGAGALLLVVRSGILARTIPIALAGRDLTINQDIKALEPSKKLGSRFLAHFLEARESDLLSKVTRGATVHKLDTPAIKSLPIPLPPLDEQKRIVEVLDAAFEGLSRARAHTETNLQNARELFESQRKSLLENAGENWKVSTLDQACKVERGSSPRPIKEFFTEAEDGVNWIKIGDTDVGAKFVTSTREKITKEGALRSRRVEIGDFILTNSMTFGRPYIMAIDGYIHDGWFVLRLNDGIQRDFFYHLLSSAVVQEQFQSLAAGAVVKNISGDLVKKAVLHIPPHQEQMAIAQQLDEVAQISDQLQSHYRAKLADLDALRQALLQKAFAGELT